MENTQQRLSELQQKITRLKKEKDIAVLAHSYQTADILEIADQTGDSFKLSTAAMELSQKTVLMCGVRFMADTVKLLSPEKTVILPAAEATCPMAEQISPERVYAFKEEHPTYKVVAYINTTTELKAAADVCVTSSSALKIVSRLPENDILFIPDKNLGSYLQKQLPEKNILLWDGCCPVHNAVTEDECRKAVAAHPGAKVLMHPELPAQVLQYADVVGSTADILKYALEHEEDCIIGTERSVRDYLALMRPQQNFYLLSKQLICADMRMTTLTDVYHAMLGECGERIELQPETARLAKHAIEEMLRLGA